jgi:ribosomal protein S18 acetylase RimI-like enzyme
MKHAYTVPGVRATANTLQFAPDSWILTGVEVAEGARGVGAGEALLRQVCADADAEGVTLYLSVQPDRETDEARLRTWYERWGFRGYVDLSPDAMRRAPAGRPT